MQKVTRALHGRKNKTRDVATVRIKVCVYMYVVVKSGGGCGHAGMFTVTGTARWEIEEKV